MMSHKRYYNRHNMAERVCHWLVAACFLLLAITGLGLYDKAFLRYFDVLGGGSRAIEFHKITGVVFFVSSVILCLQHLKDILRFDADDVAWLKCLGGYLSRDHSGPPMDKFNTGQKLFGIYMFFGTLGLAVTGFIIWSPLVAPRELVRWGLLVHSLLFVSTSVFMVIHVYLGTLGNPGTIEGILYGQVSEVWAKKHAPKWLKKMEERRRTPSREA